MAGSGSPQPKRPNPPRRSAEAARKPLQVIHISKKGEKDNPESIESGIKPKGLVTEGTNSLDNQSKIKTTNESVPSSPSQRLLSNSLRLEEADESDYFLKGMSMADLLAKEDNALKENEKSNKAFTRNQTQEPLSRSVDDFDFDEDAFLAALDENEPVGMTGEVTTGKVIAIESDGVYIDIGGKAPGFMPKKECGLGVITNLKEKFPKGLEVEVLVTREQNADGIVTISSRALSLRKSWDKVGLLAKEGKVTQIKVNGFNRGGVTCDLEGLRGFIPRSQLENGEKHEELVSKNLKVAFLEVNPETRKLVLSEKKASTAAFFSQLKVGQLIEGKVAAIKPYGFFIELGGVSGLLHHSMITNGSLRSLREVFDVGETIKAIITELDPGRRRIGLNTALLEGPPGELLIDKSKVMAEAEERAKKVESILTKKESNNKEQENNDE